jgi:hypothetical protein
MLFPELLFGRRFLSFVCRYRRRFLGFDDWRLVEIRKNLRQFAGSDPIFQPLSEKVVIMNSFVSFADIGEGQWPLGFARPIDVIPQPA